MISPSGTATAPAVATATARIPHVPAADAVRVLTFACVIAVHTFSTTNRLDDPHADAAVMLLHFTREAFFVLTAFVLMHTHLHRGLRVGPFWRRRFLLVGVPYVVWSLIYSVIGLITWDGQRMTFALPPPDVEAHTLVVNVLTGTTWYHLYFLLVSLQFYLIFPLFRRLLLATRRHPVVLLTGAAVLQVLAELWIHDPAPTGVKAELLPYAGSFVGSYVFFLVLGGVLAQHRERVLDALRRHPAWVVAAVVVTGAAAEGWYRYQIAGGADPSYAADVFQPVMLPWVVAVVALFALLGTIWAGPRPDGSGGRTPRWIVWASERSFGVFLVHPVFLWALTSEADSSPSTLLPQPWAGIAVYLIAIACSLAAVELFRHTPLQMPLTGKPKKRRSR